jgi:ketosteroid isomerase-like protein
VTPQVELITKFYSAFAKLDYKTMASCYTPDATFRDPAFELSGPDIGAMWHMLCESAKKSPATFKVEFDGIEADERGGTAHWEADYVFSQTGRKVHNVIDATFRFEGGKIAQHVDDFNFARWSRQALGAPGYLLGWSSYLQKKVQHGAMERLEKFVKGRPEYRLAGKM